MEAEARIISGEEADVFPGDLPGGRNTSHARADFEGLLELAERLQQSYDEKASARRGVFVTGQIYSLFLVLELLAGYAGMGFLSFNSLALHHSLFERSTDFVVLLSLILDAALGVITFSYLMSLRQRFQQLKHRMYADERDTSEVVELLREIEPVFAKEEKLSALERVQIRIRLSRFGVGSSSQSNAETATREQNGDSRTHKSRRDQELMKPF